MREAARSALIAALAVLALGFAAATLDSAVETDPASGEGPGLGDGSDGGGLPPPPTESPPPEPIQIPFLEEIMTVLLILAAIATLVYAVRNWRRVLPLLASIAVLVGIVALLLQLLDGTTVPTGAPSIPFGEGFPSGGGGGEDPETTTPAPPALVLVLVLGLAIVAAAVALFEGGDREDRDETDGDAEEVDPEAAAVGRAAGRAADRIEAAAGADADNEVYRAWLEMTDLLDVEDPETTTPRGFEAAAVEAGLDRGDVRELRRVFEDVRYGDREPTEDVESRAVSVFRRIEASYAGVDP